MRVAPAGVHGPTRREAAGDEWRRSSRGLYVPSWVEQTPAQRVVEAGYLVPTYGAVTGWGAMCWRGARGFDGLDRRGQPAVVTIAAQFRRIRPQPGIALCEERFDVLEASCVDGIWAASAVRAVCFLMRYADNVCEAAVALNSAALADLVSIEEASIWIHAHPSYTGIEQGRDCLALADENCWSQMEGRMLVAWVACTGGAKPLMNRPIFDLRGRHIGTPDLIDVRAGVIGQYDGRVHLATAQRRRDVVRDETYREHGLEQVIAVAGDLGTRRFDDRLRQAYLRAERRPASDRTWTTDLPDWWVPTFTVAQRRALTPSERRRWLGFRDAA